MRIRILSASVLMLCASFGAHAAGGYLNAEEIKNTFVGKTVDIHNLETGKKVQGYMDPDGTWVIYVPWKDKESNRKWWLDGDKRCSSHPKWGDSCRSWLDAGEGAYHGISDGGEHTRTLSNLRDGKQFNK